MTKNMQAGLIVGVIGLGLLMLKRTKQTNATQLTAVSPFDTFTRNFLQTKNWLEDQVKVVKEPYFYDP